MGGCKGRRPGECACATTLVGGINRDDEETAVRALAWRTMDKSTWGAGPWQDEPDKLQWPDPATGAPCMMIRGQATGAWCGYVGVFPSHPWHGLDLGDCILPDAKRRGVKMGDAQLPSWISARLAERMTCGYDRCTHTPEWLLDVHGGLSFSGMSTPLTPDVWMRWHTELVSRREEARLFPQGDAARYLAEWSGALDSFKTWATMNESRGICHVREPHDPPDAVWWFGFDCAHADDMAPFLMSLSRALRNLPGAEYRTMTFVQSEVSSLAGQLYEATGSQRGSQRGAGTNGNGRGFRLQPNN